MHQIRTFLIAGIIALLGTNAFAICRIRYNCGTDATGTAPAQQSISTATATFTPSAPGECAKDGYVFSNWQFSASSGYLISSGTFYDAAYPNTEYTIPFIDNTKTCSSFVTPLPITLTAQWVDASYVGIPVSKSYTDAQLNSRQPKFAGLGNDKLMTYSSTTNGVVGSRDIVTTLGDSTTDTTIPTRGAILTGINDKQNILSGTEGWVVENTGWAEGSVTQKPVYSTTNNYKTALVEASDLNQIVVDAVNSELIPVEGIGWQINTANNLTLPTLREFKNGITLEASINGTGTCYRRLYANSSYPDSDGTCGVATLSVLGNVGNKSGLWGAVMPYGDIVGKSVCSATQGSSNTAATDAQNAALNAEFNNQTGGVNNNSSANCWCKMESVNGYPAVSRWVFRRSNSSASDCAIYCAGAVRDTQDFRTALFNTIQQ